MGCHKLKKCCIADWFLANETRDAAAEGLDCEVQSQAQQQNEASISFVCVYVSQQRRNWNKWGCARREYVKNCFCRNC